MICLTGPVRRTALTAREFEELVQPLIGLGISHSWRSTGTAIFLELGALTPRYSPRSGPVLTDRGEASIAPYYDWRIENATTILHGASDDLSGILEALDSLRGKRIESIELTGGVPELRVKLSGGLCLRTFGMFAGDPAWAIRIRDGRWLSVTDGQVGVEEE